jgi:hypothetical protein
MAFGYCLALVHILEGNNDSCGDLFRDQSGFAKQGRVLHGKTGRVGGGNQFFRIGADSALEAGAE